MKFIVRLICFSAIKNALNTLKVYFFQQLVFEIYSYVKSRKISFFAHFVLRIFLYFSVMCIDILQIFGGQMVF